MLQFLRSKAGSWIIKILMGLIIISFAAWGIADIFVKDPNASVVAKVGNHKVTAGDVRREVYTYGNILSKQFGQEFNLDMLKEQGIPRNIVQNLMKEGADSLLADVMFLRVGDAQIRDAILKNPMFRSQDGMFDSEQFRRYMGMMGKTESALVQDTRRKITQTNISDTLGEGVSIPRLLADNMYHFKHEKRVARYIRIASKDMVAPEPKDEDLKLFHEEKKEKFMAPEYRRFQMLKLNPKDEASKIQLSDEAIKKLYDENISEYSRPEKREIDAFIVKDMETGRDVKTKLMAKTEPAKIVEALGQEKVTYNDWGLVTSDDIPEDIKDSILMLPLDGISEPLQSKDGIYVTRIKKIEKAGVDSFDTVKEHIAEKEKLNKATDQIIEITNKIDEKIAEGLTLDVIAKEMNLEIFAVPFVDQMGVFKAIPTVDNKQMPPSMEIVQTVFSSPVKEASTIQETSQGDYYSVAVEEIQPKALKPLEDVRDQVKKMWSQEQQRKLAEEKANKILEELKKGQALETLSKAENLEVKATEEFTRDGRPLKGLFPRKVLDTLFKELPNGADVGQSGDAYVVAQLDKIVPVQEKKPEDLEAIQKSLKADIKRDLMEQFQEALLKKFDAKIDEEALESAL